MLPFLFLLIFTGTAHLRSGDSREWSSFPAPHPGRSLHVKFQAARPNPREMSLVLRQRDVKNRTWSVRVNGKSLGVLQDDERRMLRILAVPPGMLRAGENSFEVVGGPGGVSDDIEISDIHLHDKPVDGRLREGSVLASVGSKTPVRFTVVDTGGWLVPLVSLRTDVKEAVRTGVIYSPDGKARIGLPAGDYRVYASRGFAYNAPMASVRLGAASRAIRLNLRREIHLPEYRAVDTHVHTLEWSGHGDATVDERVLTAAGEGLDVIATTEHNRVANYSAAIDRLGLSTFVKALPGNEVTTGMGHFNVFPASSDEIPDARENDWAALMSSLQNKVVIQNHPRDVHSGYRPFDPTVHISVVGKNLLGRPVRANAMELVNSGAMISDPLQLVRDWMGLLSRGLRVAGIGASDTHTVDFVPIGQARTYVKGADIPAGIANGDTLVSYGLLATIRQTAAFRAGTISVEVAVHAPSWSGADAITVFSNGFPVWTEKIATRRFSRRQVKLRLPAHDTHLVAVATGPGVIQPFWEIRKPYQPTSADWTPQVLGISSAIHIDGDNDGRQTSALEYAQSMLRDNRDPGLFDEAVIAHAAHLLSEQGVDIGSAEIKTRFGNRTGYTEYVAQKTIAQKK